MSRQLLMALLGAFALRGAAQLIQWLVPVGFLPGFDSFRSGAFVDQMTSVFVPGLDKQAIATGHGAKPSRR